MKHKLKRKLRSNQGVTLLLSLLLFLVCVVAGSVALTAGTASSGTLSERAKLDQRYFSVTSAAELIRKTFNGKSVRVTFEDTDVTVKIDHGGSWILRQNAHAEEKFVIDQSRYLLNTQFAGDADWQQYHFDTDVLTASANGWLKTYAVTVNSDGVDTGGLNATVEISRESSGNLNFFIKSNIARKDLSGEMKPENETFSLNVKYNASSLKTGEGDTAAFYVNWQIGTISYAY